MIVSKGIVSAAAITILAAAAQAQGGSITGIVQDSTGKRLSGVTVVWVARVPSLRAIGRD
jgi:hypothetical protein